MSDRAFECNDVCLNVSCVKFIKFIELNTNFGVSLILKALLTRKNKTKANLSWVI